jgi:hypothetical protein
MPPGSVSRVDSDIELGIATDKVCHLIVKARAFDAKEADADPDPGSNPTDDGMADVLESGTGDPVLREVSAFIRGLDEDEQMSLVALAWIGRGTFDASEWLQILETARAQHRHRVAEYLLSLPLLGDYLEEGLAAFGRNCADFNARI